MTVGWIVGEESWSKAANRAREYAPRSLPDKAWWPLDEEWLWGTIWLRDGDRDYRPLSTEDNLPLTIAPEKHGFHDGVSCSLFEFADHMASAVGPEDLYGVRRDGVIVYQQQMDALWISFTERGPTTEIRSNDAGGWRIDVPTVEVRPALERFLRTFADGIATRLPALLEWESFRSIMAWRTLPGTTRSK